MNLASKLFIGLLTLGTVCLLNAAPSTTEQTEARQILDASKVQGGLVIHLGCGDGRLTAALCFDERYLVHGLDTDAAKIAKARDTIQSLGIYGPVSVDVLRGSRLPYEDNLATLVVVEQQGDVPASEIMRVLAPGGVSCVRTGDTWSTTTKPWPKDIDDWTHYLHDASGNAVAADDKVGPPKHIHWICGPLWSRSHEFNPSLNSLVSGSGRLFYLYDDGILGLPDLRFPERWSLYGRDAFSGKFLWKVPVPNWGWKEWNTRGMWSAPLTLNRRVVTDGKHVYATLGYQAPLTVLDAASGKVVRTLSNTMGTDEIILTDGVLYLCISDQLSVATGPDDAANKKKRRLNPNEFTIAERGPCTIAAIEAASGRELWRSAPRHIGVLTLAAHGDQVCFQSENDVVCLNRKSGQQLWTAKAPAVKGSRHLVGTLVMYDKEVLFTSATGLQAFDVKDGKVLWTGPKMTATSVTQPPNLFVANGLVWGNATAGYDRQGTSVKREGRDPFTGDVKQTVSVSELISPLHHFRCYREKATDHYLMLTKRGAEFLDLKGEDHMRNDWIRAMCHYGFMPCNGQLYVPPSHCFCYPGVKMTGFMSLTGDKAGAIDAGPQQPRLEKGPAFGQIEPIPTAAGDWPTYRHDTLRSGSNPTAVSSRLEPAWSIKLGGKVSAPVVVGNRLYLAQVDAQRVLCLNATTGATNWTFTAGARVDSAPTIYEGMALFGSHDGWVYCLRASDGGLAWRFRAAPVELRTGIFEQLESPWPVPGNVLIAGKLAYFSAGRSSFLDGGVYIYGLNPRTGEVVHEQKVDGPWPDVTTEVGRPFDMDGVKSDILSGDGTNVFLFQMTFDKELNDVTKSRVTNLGDRMTSRHMIPTGGFLQDTWYDRTYWTHSDRWPGFYYSNDAPKTGQILVFDDKVTYGVHVYTERLRLSPSFTPGDKGYTLFADANDNEPVLKESAIDKEKGAGFSRAKPPLWSKQIRQRAEAMVLAGDKLFMAGPPDVVPEDDPYAAFDGRLGADLWVVSTKDGEKLAQRHLDTLPALDGLIAANQRLYLVTKDGRLDCFK